MSAKARETVARAIQFEAPGRCPTHMAQQIADAALAALKPIIAAEIRTHREELDEENVCICGHHGNYPDHVANRITR